MQPDPRRESGTHTMNDEKLPKDTVFEIISNPRRQEVIRAVAENGEQRLGDLSDVIAGKLNGIDPEDVTTTQRKNVYVGLYQVHLPDLHKKCVVDYDERSGRIEEGEHLDHLYHVLDSAEEAHEEGPGSEESEEDSAEGETEGSQGIAQMLRDGLWGGAE